MVSSSGVFQPNLYIDIEIDDLITNKISGFLINIKSQVRAGGSDDKHTIKNHARI